MPLLKDLKFWAIVTGLIELATCCHGTGLFSTLEGVMRKNNYSSIIKWCRKNLPPPLNIDKNVKNLEILRFFEIFHVFERF